MALPVVHIRVKGAIHGMWIALLVGAAYMPGFASAQIVPDELVNSRAALIPADNGIEGFP